MHFCEQNNIYFMCIFIIRIQANIKPYSFNFKCFFRKIVKTEGLLALMKGAGIRMITIAPTFGIIQTLYYLGIGEYIMDVPED